MQAFFSLILLTLAYGLFILSVFPQRYFRKLSHLFHHKESPEYSKVSLSAPIFFSFLIGYSLAATMLYFFIF
jgi:hypothetical protein